MGKFLQRVNFDLTKAYLDLIVTYVSLMILLSRVEDRKIVLGLYNVAYEIIHGHGDTSFPRLGELINDYEQPMKKLAEEFVPHSTLLQMSLVSFLTIFPDRNDNAGNWRKKHLFSLIANPENMLVPHTNQFEQCSYLSIDAMERYVICKVFSFLKPTNIIICFVF